jgi:lysophospholipase L1-like esterase
MIIRAVMLSASLWLVGISSISAQIPAGPQAGQKVAFLGDSITQFGEGPGGYVRLVASAMHDNARDIIIVPAGVSGNTSKDMLARLGRDVLSKKPDWMTLSCGVNDVWHGANGVPLDQYKTNITSIVDQATAAGIKVCILTATMITEDPGNAFNQKLAPYNDFLRDLAKQRNLPLADLNAEMRAELTQMRAGTPPPGNLLTVDGVHMNGLGNEMMAAGILKAFGLTDGQIAAAKKAWFDQPDGASLSAKISISVRQLEQLQAARAQDKQVDATLNRALNKAAADYIATLSAASPAPAAAPSP